MKVPPDWKGLMSDIASLLPRTYEAGKAPPVMDLPIVIMSGLFSGPIQSLQRNLPVFAEPMRISSEMKRMLYFLHSCLTPMEKSSSSLKVLNGLSVLSNIVQEALTPRGKGGLRKLAVDALHHESSNASMILLEEGFKVLNVTISQKLASRRVAVGDVLAEAGEFWNNQSMPA